MLSKLFPRKINHSADSKSRGKDDMFDAQNISVSGDVEGDEGVIKPIKSNVSIPSEGNLFGSASDKTVLGKVTDSKYNVVYFFVYSSVAAQCGVYAYDPFMYFDSHEPESLIKIYTSAAFAFTAEGFINADITYSQRRYGEYEDTPILFFTDNKNEPRKLNVLRAYNETLSAYSVDSITDLITACPKAPVYPITFTFGANSTPNSEFRNINGFQFAYQSVFKDSNVSAISTYSRLAVPPSYVNQGTALSASLEQDNVINLTIPVADLSSEVSKVKILARRGANGSWFEVTEKEYSGSAITYAFDNTTVNIAIPKDDQIKQFDNLPKAAQTQTIEGNRLFYGNYLEGFDNVEAEATITAVPKERQLDFLSYNVTLKPATCLSDSFTDNDFSEFYQYTGIDIAGEGITNSSAIEYDGAINKNTAFVISASDLPVTDIFETDDEFTLTFSIQPKNNWHIYDVDGSYHQHMQLGDEWTNDRVTDSPTSTGDADGEYLSSPFWQNKNHSGADFIESFDGPPTATNLDPINLINPNTAPDVGPTKGVPAICNKGVTNSLANQTNEFGVNDNISKWSYLADVSNLVAETNFGTSAANPLIVKGMPIEISITLKAKNNNIRRQDITHAAATVLSKQLAAGTAVGEGGTNGMGVTEDNFDVIASPFNTGGNLKYTYDLGLSDGEDIAMTDPLADLIVMTGPDGITPFSPILGSFIINKATVEFGFFIDDTYNAHKTTVPAGDSEEDPPTPSSNYWTGEGRGGPNVDDDDFTNDWTDKRRVGLYIKRIYGVEVLTCLRKSETASPWRVLHPSTALGFDYNNLTSGASSIVENSTNYNLYISDFFEPSGPFSTHVGKLIFTDDYDPDTGIGEPFYSGENSAGLSCFTLLDGAGGMGGGPVTDAAVTSFDNFKVHLAPNDVFILGAGNLGSAPMFGGLVGGPYDGFVGFPIIGPIVTNVINQATSIETYNYDASSDQGQNAQVSQVESYSLMPLISHRAFAGFSDGGTYSFRGLEGILDAMPFENFNSGDGIELGHSAATIFGISFSLNSESADSLRSFKTGANHAFGVVYYDQRGRSSSVYPIGAAFSPPYHSRPTNKYGRVEMQIALEHSAPAWAEAFQIVYAGNTSIVDFTQYTSGGAFFVNGTEDSEDGNIYVSLNYLQTNNDVSYTEAFGARSPEGGRDLYTFKEGDVLKVISYYTNDDNRIFVDETIEFDVAGQRTLGSGEDNPLYNPQTDGASAHPSKQGNFVILKNNPIAFGFAFQDVKEGSNDPNAQSHNWNKRCVIEISTPTDAQAEDNLIFYETSKVFPVSDHANTITIQDGDVWWRRVPVAIARFNDFIFESLIGNYISEGGNGSTPRFEPYYLETKGFNDTVRNSDVTGKGKVKIVQPNTEEARRFCSLTYSDKTNPASNILKLTSFNPAKLQFKDLPVEHGNINYILPQQDSIFVVHANKCASIPVDRNIITTASDTQSLVAASQVLGTERYFAGDFGCDNNPESVCVVGNNVYFASKSKREVYRFNPSQGVEVISDKGMKSFFRKLFKDAMDQEAGGAGLVKVVGGYDPAKDEFILSVYNSSLAEGTSISSASTVTPLTNALEEQLFQFIKGTLDVEQDGQNVFTSENLPDNLKNFYNNYQNIGYDLDASYLLDSTGDGLFTFSDVASFGQIGAALQVAATQAKERIESSVLATIFAAIDTDTEEGAAAHAAGTTEAVAQYINGLEVTVDSQKQTISDLETLVWGGDGFSIGSPAPASLQGQLNTANTNLSALQGQLGEFTDLNLSAEAIAEKLAKLAAFELALADAGHGTTLTALQGVISDLEVYSDAGTVIDFKNALNTQQALSSLGVDLSAVGVVAGALSEINAETQSGQISSDLNLADIESWNNVVDVLVASGYSGDVSGFMGLLFEISQYKVLDGGIGSDSVPTHVGRITTKLGYYGQLEAAGFDPENITVSDFLASLDLTPDVNPLQADLDAFTSVGVGTPDEYSSYVNQGSISDITQAFTDLSNYLAIGNFTTHSQAQEALQTSYDGWQTWGFMENAGYSTNQVTSILTDYGVFNTLGFTVSEAGIWGSVTPSAAYSDALSDVITAEGLTDEAIAAASVLATNNLVALNTLSTTLGVTEQAYADVAAGLAYLNTVDFELGGGDVTATAELLALQIDMASILNSLSISGWSPISLPETINSSTVEGLTEQNFTDVTIAIGNALGNLSGWQSTFQGQGQAVSGGGEEYFTGDTQNTESPNNISLIESLNVPALRGVSNALELIHNLNAAGGPDFIVNPLQYIPTNIANFLSSGPNTLNEYASAKGVSPNEIEALKQALFVADSAEGSPWAGGGTGFKGVFSDGNSDGDIGSADLLEFLILYGTTNFDSGSLGEEGLDAKFFVEPEQQ